MVPIQQIQLLCWSGRLLTGHASFTAQHIPGSSQAVLSALAWLEDDGGAGSPRLVSGGLDGSLTEWDLTSLRPAAVTDSFGGAVWALAVQPPQADGALLP